jgi:hypothetical protein
LKASITHRATNIIITRTTAGSFIMKDEQEMTSANVKSKPGLTYQKQCIIAPSPAVTR